MQQLLPIISDQPYPLLFATISGAHLYGFPSPDSDYDLRGCHILPVPEIVGLEPGRDTIALSQLRDGMEIDLVTHDIKKFFLMLLKKNGYVLEQLYSPLIVRTTPEHEELKFIAKGCITRHHVHHYSGFAQTQWRLFEKDKRVKPLLYIYRVLLTGIYLMQTGVVEANLVNLNEIFQLPYIPDLISRKLEGAEKSVLADADTNFHQREFDRLRGELEAAFQNSNLPEAPSAKARMNDLLVRLRMNSIITHGQTYLQMGRTTDLDTNTGTTCPVCHLENAFAESGNYEICPQCNWEDDPVQRNNPDFPGGANPLSIKAAQEAWLSKSKVN